MRGGRGGGGGEMAIVVVTMNVMKDKKRGRSQATAVRDITGYATPTSHLNTRSAANKICTKHSKIMAPACRNEDGLLYAKYDSTSDKKKNIFMRN